MDAKQQMYQHALKEAQALSAKGNLTPQEVNDLAKRTERLVRMRLDLEQAKSRDAIKDAFDAATPKVGASNDDGSGFGGDWQPLSEALSLKFGQAEMKNLHQAALSKTPFRTGAKAVQAESDFDQADAAFFDLTRIAPNRARFRVASLLPATVKLGDGNSVTYYKPSTLATAAAATAEAAALTQSSPTWVAVDEPIRKVGHYAHVPDEAVQDWADFQSVLGQELLDGLISVENAQLLVGSGVAPNLAGIYDDSRAVTARAQGTDMVADAIMKALGDVRDLGNVEPDAIIMRASDWIVIRTLKDNNDRYIFGDATSSGEKRIDGVPVYLTNDGTAGHVYVGSFASAKAYIRKMPTVESTITDSDDFVKDLAKFRVTERFALAVPRPTAFCDLTLA